MAGRKRKPAGSAVPQGGRPTAPETLSKREATAFAALVDLLDAEKLISASHVHTIAMAAQRLVEIEDLSALVQQHGAVYEATNIKGEFKLAANPAVAQRSEAFRHFHSLLAELGLTPTSVAKATPPKKEEAANAFARFTKRK